MIVLVLVGPTAVGKSELAIKLAQKLNGEIISADSMQVYREMDIGTAKPSQYEQELIPHHLIDIVDPNERFNVADYVRLAESKIEEIVARNRLPIIAGGTGLYINALFDGFLFPDSGADPTLRKQLQQQAKDVPESLHKQLIEIDPESAKRLHPNDHRRIIRALEVYHTTGKTITELQSKMEVHERKYRPIFIGLNRERTKLYQRIETRVDQMIKMGLVNEVVDLLIKYPEQPTALQAIGYKEIALFLHGHLTLEEAIYVLKRDTRRYAKRQLSWFRRDKRIQWFDLDQTRIEVIINQIQSKIVELQAT